MATDHVTVVYGTIPIVIAAGPRKVMEAYVERMNAQAPEYNHRIEEVP